MCGIAGLLSGHGTAASSSLLLEMAGELTHRGPDGAGLYIDGSFGMVNTRLSIIDILGGDQPIGNESGRYWVVQNGEIYNYPELTEELCGLGHVFSSRSDTEVLVHAYEQWGPDCLCKLNGEFAFAIWDHQLQELFLARDRFGIRPLFLAEPGGDLCFASEIKALLRHPNLVRDIDPRALIDVFTMWSTLPDRTAFAGVRELPPGHFLRIRANGTRQMSKWWDVPFVPPDQYLSGTSDEMAEQLLVQLEDATRIRLRADVPVGVYVSGGLDSSVTTALARRHTSRALQGFGIGFTDPRYDETSFQEIMAGKLGLQLEHLQVDGADIAADFPHVIALAECPMLRTAPAPLLRLSRLVRTSGFKVVLTGEGADELFAGYNIFRETMVRRFWSREHSSSTRAALLRRLYPYLPRSISASGALLESFFGVGLHETSHPLYSHRIRFKNAARGLRLLRQEVIESTSQEDPEERLIARLPSWFSSIGPLSRAQYLEIHTFMQGYLLHAQGDRMLMGNSVEGRFPFLDCRVAELAARIPERLRLRGLREKHLLRKAVTSLLPDKVVEREKRPYRAPILAAFIGKSSPEYVEESLHPQTVEKAGLFSPLAVSRLVEKCRRNLDVGVSETDEMALVGVLSTMLLHRKMVQQPELALPSQPKKIVEGTLITRDSRKAISEHQAS